MFDGCIVVVEVGSIMNILVIFDERRNATFVECEWWEDWSLQWRSFCGLML